MWHCRIIVWTMCQQYFNNISTIFQQYFNPAKICTTAVKCGTTACRIVVWTISDCNGNMPHAAHCSIKVFFCEYGIIVQLQGITVWAIRHFFFRQYGISLRQYGIGVLATWDFFGQFGRFNFRQHGQHCWGSMDLWHLFNCRHELATQEVVKQQTNSNDKYK